MATMLGWRSTLAAALAFASKAFDGVELKFAEDELEGEASASVLGFEDGAHAALAQFS